MKPLFISILIAVFCSLSFIAKADDNLTIKINKPVSFRVEMYELSALKFEFEATHSSKTISELKIKIGSSTYTCTKSGNEFSYSTWQPATLTNQTLDFKYWVKYSDNSLSQEFSKVLTIIKINECPIPQWTSGREYPKPESSSIKPYVYHNGSLYEASWWADDSAGEPSVDNVWKLLGGCNFDNYLVMDCSDVEEFSSSVANYNLGDRVKYQGILYEAAGWANIAPNTQSTNPWINVAVCATVNSIPNITCNVNNKVIISSDANQTVNISATITDDNSLNSIKFYIDNQLVTHNSEGGNSYTYVLNTNQHKTYTLKIIAEDNEFDTTEFITYITIANSEIPEITLIQPVNNAKVAIYDEGTNSVSFIISATDPDGSITSAQYSLDGTTFNTMLLSDGKYSAKWTSPVVGDHKVYFKVTDNTNSSTIKEVDFSIYDNSVQEISFAKVLKLSDVSGAGMGALPELVYQTSLELGRTKTLIFDQTITNVKIRSKSLADVEIIDGTKLKIKGFRTGRTGLIITSDSKQYLLGLKINNYDATVPGLPDYVSVGSIFVKQGGDFKFWGDVQDGLKGKEIDALYKYCQGGADYVKNPAGNDIEEMAIYAGAAKAIGAMMFYVYYNIPDPDESKQIAKDNFSSAAYRTKYFDKLKNFLDRIGEVMGDEKFGVIIEPDFLGYMQTMTGGTLDPNEDVNGMTLRQFVEEVNKFFKNKREEGINVEFGWKFNLWASPNHSYGVSVIKYKDAQINTIEKQIANVKEAGKAIGDYGKACGVDTHGANFVVIDRYGVDSGAVPPEKQAYWANNDHWTNYMIFANEIATSTGLPMICWQLPLGRINNSKMVSVYTNQLFEQDSKMDAAVDFFFGDTFNPAIQSIDDLAISQGQQTRFEFFSENKHNDPNLKINGTDITWDSHIDKAYNYNIIGLMFGHGLDGSGQGVGAPPHDQYYSIQKFQNYYLNKKTYFNQSIINSTVLTYTLSLTNVDLKDKISGASMFYGKSCTKDGIFNPQEAGLGPHWITYLIDENSVIKYKAVKIEVMIDGDYSNLEISSDYTNTSTYTQFKTYDINFIFKNSGTQSMTISDISFPSFLTNTSSTNITIQAGSQETITVKFNPLEVKKYTGSIIVTANNTIGTNKLDLSIDVVASTTQASVISLDVLFEESVFFVNDKYNGILKIRNIGDKTLDVSSINFPDWVQGNTWSGTIETNGFKDIEFTFSPNQIKTYTGDFVVASNASSGNNTYTANLKVVEVSQDDVMINLSGDLNFEQVVVGAKAYKVFTITNSGVLDLEINGITYPEGFLGDNYIGVLKSKEKIELVVTFNPTNAKKYTGQISVNSNKTVGDSNIDVVGTGVESQEQYLTIFPLSLKLNKESIIKDIEVSSNTDWNILENADWIEIDEPTSLSGSKNKTVKINFSENTKSYSRSSRIFFTSSDNELLVILEITQTSEEENVGIKQINSKSFKIYPNPLKNYFIIENLKHEKIKCVKIYSTTGKLLKSINKISNSNNKIDMQEFKNGVYLINIKTNNKIYVSKILVKR